MNNFISQLFSLAENNFKNILSSNKNLIEELAVNLSINTIKTLQKSVSYNASDTNYSTPCYIVIIELYSAETVMIGSYRLVLNMEMKFLDEFLVWQ